MLKVTRETSDFRQITLFETKMLRIIFVECKYDKSLDNVKFIRLGTLTTESEKTVIYRWQDEEAINDILRRYGAE